MDVHPTKNVSIGIDPYPFKFSSCLMFQISYLRCLEICDVQILHESPWISMILAISSPPWCMEVSLLHCGPSRCPHRRSASVGRDSTEGGIFSRRTQSKAYWRDRRIVRLLPGIADVPDVPAFQQEKISYYIYHTIHIMIYLKVRQWRCFFQGIQDPW